MRLRPRGLLAASLVMAATLLIGCGDETAPSPIRDAPPDSTPAAAAAVAPGSPAVSAARVFLDLLSSEQRAAAVLAPDDPARANWSNLPASATRFERNGLRIGDLNLEQIDALHHFLAAALSSEGYRTVLGIVRAEDALAAARGSDRSAWSSDNYWLGFFGEPSERGVWGWQFGGHHLAVNVTVLDQRSYLSPTFLGVEPASYEVDGATVAPLEPYVEAGTALFNALDDPARAQATLTARPNGVVAGAGRDGLVPDVEGVAAGDLTAGQQQLLLDAVGLWVGVLDRGSAQARMEEIRSELDEIHFAWSGEPGGGSVYFRIHGPSLLIEFSTEGRMGGGGPHYHSVYRDPTNEYGSAAVNST